MKPYLVLFFLFFSSATGCLSAGENPVWEKIEAWFANFEEYLSRTDIITPGELQKLPVGLRTTVGNYRYDLLFTDAVFSPDQTELAIYLRISGPDWQGEERALYFGADKVLVSSRGGYLGEVKLALLGDVTLKGKGDRFRLRFLGRKEDGEHAFSSDGLPPSYAVVDCEGFRQLQLSVELEVGNGQAVLVEKGKLTDKPLLARFFCTAEAIDDIVVKVDLPEFALKHLPDWRFAAEEVMLDFSQRRNAPGFKPYPDQGKGNTGNADFDEIWQGLYARKIRLGFPDYIRKADGARPSVLAENFWWDESGCTGHFAAIDLLRLDEGSLGGWGFSIEEFSFDLVKDRLDGGGMEGRIELPVSRMGAYDYELGFKRDGTWDMKLGLGEKTQFDFLRAREVELYASSYLEMQKEKDSGVLLQACLSGRMKLNPVARENDRFGFANLEFTGMRIRNKAPYFEIDRIRWDDDLEIGNFPVSIRDIAVTAKQENLSLGFKTRVHFGDEEDAHFGGDLDLVLRSSIREKNGRQEWVFDGVDIGEVRVDFSNSYLAFDGGVRFVRDHKVYGNAFQGQVDLMIHPINAGVRADLMLGARPSYRYWYADLLARLGPAGIPVFPGFKIAALGGGAYKRMDMLPPESGSSMGGFGENAQVGQTASGLTYVPDSTKSLGLKSTVVLAMQEDRLFNAELTFEMLFNGKGGISRTGMRGVGKFMTRQTPSLSRFNQQILNLARKVQPTLEQQRMAASSEASVTAEVELGLDFENKAFTGSFDAYMDLGVLKGAGTKGHLGTMGMFIGQDAWYVKVGEPVHPLGMKLRIGPLQAGLDAYFMTGSHLPEFPSPPADVAALLGGGSYPKPDLKTLSRGAGLAFGSRFHFSTGTIPMLIFYGAFDADLGFDLMMKQYPNSLCQESGTEPGINGWYARGQAYSYLMADIGLYLKLFGKKRNFSVLKGEVGALLQAGLPNPASFAGNLGLNVSILNGLVKGRFNLDFDLGEPCTVLNQGFADGVGIIASTLPQEGDGPVDVFAVPQAAFNLPVEKPIREEYGNEEKDLEITLDRYELWYGGSRLEGRFEYGQDHRLLKFVSRDILPPNARLDMRLAIGARERKGASWSRLKDQEGENYKEERSYSFRTGDAPDSIPWENVRYCYPVRDQKFFFPGEHKKGFVYLERGMAGLLTDPAYRKRIVLVSDTDSLAASFTYNQAERRLSWYMPESLRLSARYELRVVLEPVPDGPIPVSSGLVAGEASSSNSRLENTVLYASDAGTLNQETIRLTKSESKSGKNKVILRYSFQTSRYRTFGEKLADVELERTYRTPVVYQDAEGNPYVTDPDVHYLQARMRAGEPFCLDEREGSRYSGGKPLVDVRADLGNEPYYRQDIYPLVYAEYPYGGIVDFGRESGHENIVPDWAVFPSGGYREDRNTDFPWIYCLPIQYKRDFHMVLTSVAEQGIRANPYYLTWLGKHFKPIREGFYPVFLQYVLPDGTVTSRRRMVFENR